MYCISLKTSHPIADVRLKAALNRWLPLSIAVLDCEEADIDFHARYSCTSKEYIIKYGTPKCEIRFLTVMLFITDISLTKICLTVRRRLMWVLTILLLFALSTAEKKEI